MNVTGPAKIGHVDTNYIIFSQAQSQIMNHYTQESFDGEILSLRNLNHWQFYFHNKIYSIANSQMPLNQPQEHGRGFKSHLENCRSNFLAGETN